MHVRNLVGQPPFGKLTVLRRDESNTASGQTRWICQCACGSPPKSFIGAKLTAGTTTSCGCRRVEWGRERGLANVKHGNARHGPDRNSIATREYETWNRIKGRCLNRTNKGFADYGGRGIRMCERWTSSFEAFLEDLGPRPPGQNGKRPLYSIDRKDNDGHYSCGKCPECLTNGWPMNCHWTTGIVQSRNKRSTILITIDGITKPLIEWATEAGLEYFTVWKRLKSYGMSPDEALRRPLQHGGKKNPHGSP